MDKTAFYITVKAKLGALTASQINGFEAVLQAIDGQPLSHRAYCLATAWHETARTMLPVREAYWCSEDWRRTHLKYYPYYGRGYVQLTWGANYIKADKELGLGGTLINHLDRAMEPPIAAKIMRKGMDEGWFTGVSLGKVLPASGMANSAQYINARKIINGSDKAETIEGYAQVFEKALRDAGIK